jgi:hypothetical protein
MLDRRGAALAGGEVDFAEALACLVGLQPVLQSQVLHTVITRA